MHILKRLSEEGKIKKAHTSWQPQRMQNKWAGPKSVSHCSAELFERRLVSLPVSSTCSKVPRNNRKPTTFWLSLQNNDIILNLWIENDYVWFLTIRCCSFMYGFKKHLSFSPDCIMQHILGKCFVINICFPEYLISK